MPHRGQARVVTGVSVAVSALGALQLVEHELLVFAAFWFAVGLFDEIAVDLAWLWLRLTGRAIEERLGDGFEQGPLQGLIAVFIPAWHEPGVIGTTIAHALAAWPQHELRLYVGCYCNDPATLAAAVDGAGNDPRLRIVVHEAEGPTTKADCLNRLHLALCDDEQRLGRRFRAVVLQDAEDMVHPAALSVIDLALDRADFVQLPVVPELQPSSRWIAGHYADEFAEDHTKTMVVRSALGAALPASGVGCGFAREALAQLAQLRSGEGEPGPFASECLTEDYELGLLLSRGRRGIFVRLRDSEGQLVATRSYFPDQLVQAVRQKTRWMHGIAFQSWDRLGWHLHPVEMWMALRDRRGPLAALVLGTAYLLLIIDALLGGARLAGMSTGTIASPALRLLVVLSFAGFAWRSAMRFVFTRREYGWREGLRAIGRIPVSNIIAIMAGRRALAAYLRSLRGEIVRWDKTPHLVHPADALRTELRA
jgi:adsorption protein B